MLTAQYHHPTENAMSSIPSEHDSVVIEEAPPETAANEGGSAENDSTAALAPVGGEPVERKRRPAGNAAWRPYISAIQSHEGFHPSPREKDEKLIARAELREFYQVQGKGNTQRIRLVLPSPHGYRFHPAIVRDLAAYQEVCALGKMPHPQLFIRLVAGLVQDR